MVKVKEFESFLDKIGHERLQVRLEFERGNLSDVVFQYESFIDGQWFPIVRYDCVHGFFHRDIMKPNGDKEKRYKQINLLINTPLFIIFVSDNKNSL